MSVSANPWLRRMLAQASGTLVMAIGLVGFLVPLQAHAVLPSSVACNGITNATFVPGITYEPQEIMTTVVLDYFACTIINGGQITMAQDAATIYTASRSCHSLLGTLPGVDSVLWNTGQVSVANVDITYTQEASALVATTFGTVVSGPFTGYRVRRVVTYADVTVATACLAPGGLQSLSNGLNTLTILPVLTQPDQPWLGEPEGQPARDTAEPTGR